MMLMGDEYGHTRYGNNNSYGHDTALNNFQWQQVKIYHFLNNFDLYSTCLMVLFMLKQLNARKSDHFRFFSEVVHYRQKHRVFSHENFLDRVFFFTLVLVKLHCALTSSEAQ